MNRVSKSKDEVKTIFLNALHQIAPEIEPEEIDPQSSLQDQYELDSMDFLRLMVLLNHELNLEVPESDYHKLSTLSDCIDYFTRRLAAG
jgi:acyl carrier protein